MNIYITGDNIISALGFTTAENMLHLLHGTSGIRQTSDTWLSPEPFQAAIIDQKRLANEFNKLQTPDVFTKIEQIMLISVKAALEKSKMDGADSKTIFIIATTKGNIELLEPEKKKKFPADRIYLWNLANTIATWFKNPNAPIIVSNACISGVLAIEIGARLLRAGQYNNAIIVGADILTPFVVSGFQSFKSLSPLPCKPYDISRDGLSLGEAAATIVLSAQKQALEGNNFVTVAGGASSNDANHISGPSRTGDGLNFAITAAMQASGLKISDIGFINAHGTATPFNDDMESKAINLAGMQHIPLNSLKGYFGHTLGAAGALESIISIHAMLQQKLIKTEGIETPGVAEPINIVTQTQTATINNFIKMASGFGGCNAAVIFSKQ